MKHLMTIDTEDWFQVFYDNSDTFSWDNKPSKIRNMLWRTLDILEASETQATFFCVGWIAEKHPELIRQISENGHEIACHGYWHRPVGSMTVTQFREDIVRAKSSLEQIVGLDVDGYRAPGFTLKRNHRNYIDEIQNAGFKYDCSILQVDHRPHVLQEGLIEIPPTGIRLFNGIQPTNGGFVFRSMPYWMYSMYLRKRSRANQPLNFYVHTWEIECDFPRVIRHPLRAFVQYYNLHSVKGKFARLLKDFQFIPINQSGLIT